jgi:hypothetical protein
LVLFFGFVFGFVLFFVGCCGNSVVGRILEVKGFWKDFLLGERRGEERRGERRGEGGRKKDLEKWGVCRNWEMGSE